MSDRPPPLWLGTLLATVTAISGCSERFTDDQQLGGKTVTAEVLNRGMAIYRKDCSGCHGTDGKGSSPTSTRERPARDLTLGFYKFTSVRDGGLPTDDDLARTIRDGLDGTQMTPRRDLSTQDLAAVADYVKTLSPRWRAEAQGAPVPVHADPWGGDRMNAIVRGSEVYHGVAQCWTCHPAYASKANIQSLTEIDTVTRDHSFGIPVRFRADMAHSETVETRYGKVLPPDFLGDRVRAAKGPEGLYRVIAAGVGGTPMPAWVDRLPPKDLWAVVHYIAELARVRGTAAARGYRDGVPWAPKKGS